jgi:hypothetical protein
LYWAGKLAGSSVVLRALNWVSLKGFQRVDKLAEWMVDQKAGKKVEEMDHLLDMM